MSGVLACSDDGDHYFVAWSIDQLRITGEFYGDTGGAYRELLSKALKVRDGVK
jgi:hypothetical protein